MTDVGRATAVMNSNKSWPLLSLFFLCCALQGHRINDIALYSDCEKNFEWRKGRSDSQLWFFLLSRCLVE